MASWRHGAGAMPYAVAADGARVWRGLLQGTGKTGLGEDESMSSGHWTESSEDSSIAPVSRE